MVLEEICITLTTLKSLINTGDSVTASKHLPTYTGPDGLQYPNLDALSQQQRVQAPEPLTRQFSFSSPPNKISNKDHHVGVDASRIPLSDHLHTPGLQPVPLPTKIIEVEPLPKGALVHPLVNPKNQGNPNPGHHSPRPSTAGAYASNYGVPETVRKAEYQGPPTPARVSSREYAPPPTGYGPPITPAKPTHSYSPPSRTYGAPAPTAHAPPTQSYGPPPTPTYAPPPPHHHRTETLILPDRPIIQSPNFKHQVIKHPQFRPFFSYRLQPLLKHPYPGMNYGDDILFKGVQIRPVNRFKEFLTYVGLDPTIADRFKPTYFFPSDRVTNSCYEIGEDGEKRVIPSNVLTNNC